MTTKTTAAILILSASLALVGCETMSRAATNPDTAKTRRGAAIGGVAMATIVGPLRAAFPRRDAASLAAPRGSSTAGIFSICSRLMMTRA